MNRLTRQLIAEIRQMTGRIYGVDFDKLDEQEIKELIRLLRDIEAEHRTRLNRARIMPWRRG